MRCRNALLATSALLLTGFAACKYNPSVHPDTLKCNDDNGCPSGYRCVGAAVEKSGVCCNKPDAAMCLGLADGASTDVKPTDAPADGIASGDGSGSQDLNRAGDVSAERQALEVNVTDRAETRVPDSNSPGFDAASDLAGTGGTIGTADAGDVDAPVATGGVGGTDAPTGTDRASITDGPTATDAVDAPVATGGTGGIAGATGTGGVSGTGGTTGTGGTATGGAATGGTSTGGTSTGGTSTGGTGGAVGGTGGSGVVCPGTMCGSTCSDLTTDVNNCGACVRPCQNTNAQGLSCHAGLCDTPACTTGWGNCTQPAAPLTDNGCETILNTSTNCGGCGIACALGQRCSGGVCVCDGTSCPSGCCNGKECEAYASQTALMCGTAGATCTACVSGQRCSGGACVCDGTSCPSGCCNGNTCESQTALMCGTAGATCTACTGGRTCQSGTCACPSGLSVCGGTCVNAQTSVANCGGCGTVCSVGDRCSGGRCVCDGASCPSGCCNNGTCRAYASQTALMCGTGGATCTACASGQRCSGGACICDATSCPPGPNGVKGCCSGYCVDFTMDGNCGGCGISCANMCEPDFGFCNSSQGSPFCDSSQCL